MMLTRRDQILILWGAGLTALVFLAWAIYRYVGDHLSGIFGPSRF